jgi:hypothetical protein
MNSHLMDVMIAALLLAPFGITFAQDANIPEPIAKLEKLLSAEPLVIEKAQISRPKAKGDITLRAEVSFGGAAPIRVKLRKAEPGADSFNNVPRYDLAAYELQKLFLDPAEYVVPPTMLRMVPLADIAKYSPAVERTFNGADQVLCVVQYWLSDILVLADVYNPEQFANDAVYARHIEELNILTFLIEHRDSNLGNFLISKERKGARVFSIDHGVAFASTDSDRGDLWRVMRVKRLPADTVERLRKISSQVLDERMGVLAQWKLQGGKYVAVAAGENLSPFKGVRRRGDVLQMGLTRSEIGKLERQLKNLLKWIDSGEIAVTPVKS